MVHTSSLTREPIHHTVLLLVARYESDIHILRDQLDDLPLDKVDILQENSRARANDGVRASDSVGGVEHTARGCSYKEFLKCKPRNFNGTEGTVGLTRWFEKMELVFRISKCAENYKVKYATCTLLDGALTWWNACTQSIGIDVAYQTPWKDLKKMMTEEYCPRNELQKMEVEF
ncbi:hypothetical protein Tco_0784247 [Tanacetum coccineum]